MIIIKSKEEIEIMREGGRILAEIMEKLKENSKPGVSTKEIDKIAEREIKKVGGTPNFAEEGHPTTICASINEEIVHGPASERKLEEGDIFSIDMGMRYKGYNSDMAITIPIGNVDPETKRLIRVTKKALKIAIKKSKPNNSIGDISHTIQKYVESQGFNVVRELCGHGIGKELHEDPQILNYGKRNTGSQIKEGMTFCLEPMVSMGTGEIKKLDNGVYKPKDDSLSAHFEKAIAITKNGPKILTTV